jgi:uncharacterized membrane protein
MLLYLLKILDNSWPLFVLAPLIFYPLRADKGITRSLSYILFVTLGAIIAILYAVFKRNTGWVVREYYDILILWPLILLLGIFLILFLVSKGRASGKIVKLSVSAMMCLVLARVLPVVIILPLDFDVGMSSIFNMEYLSRVTGYVLALMLLFLIFLSERFLLIRLGERVALLLVSLALFIALAYFFIDALRIMFVRRMLPNYDFIADIVIFFLSRENFFIFLELGVFAIAALYVFFKSFVEKVKGANPAIRRKARYGLILERRAAIFLLIVVGAVFFTGGTLRAIHERGPYISEPEGVLATNGEIALPIEIVGDGNLHRYLYISENGVGVRFIVIKKSANAYGVGLDACDICGATGYYQRGDQVVCKLCDVVMNKSTIGFPGGCNPVPLSFFIREGKLVIKASDLRSEEHRFR